MEQTMTRIDFYTNVADRIQYACRLARKARAARCRIVMLTTPEDIDALDLALWSVADDAFLPHVRATDSLAAQTPIILSDKHTDELPHHEVLINLTDSTPSHFARFERLLEVVPGSESEKNAGRARYTYYKERGYPLSHFIAEST